VRRIICSMRWTLNVSSLRETSEYRASAAMASTGDWSVLGSEGIYFKSHGKHKDSRNNLTTTPKT
jgi:hypothetical protein